MKINKTILSHRIKEFKVSSDLEFLDEFLSGIIEPYKKELLTGLHLLPGDFVSKSSFESILYGPDFDFDYGNIYVQTPGLQ